MRDGLLTPLCGEMSGKENYEACQTSFYPKANSLNRTERYIANLAISAVRQPADALKLKGRLISE